MIILDPFDELWTLLPVNVFLRFLLRDPDSDFHPEFVFHATKIRASQGSCAGGIASDRHADQIATADQSVCRVEFDPSRARKIDLAPGVG